jgi:glycosyltransferase involved in cell wall biosynthesis
MNCDRKVIVSTHDWLYPIYGGGGLRTLKVAEEFKRRGYNVVILAPSKINKIKEIPVYTLPPPTKKRSQVLSAIKFNIRSLRSIIKVSQDADLIFVHNTIAAVAFAILNKFLRKRFILDITDIHAEYLWVGNISIIEKLLRFILLKIEYNIIKSADTVIVVTEIMKQRCIEKGIEEDKIRVICDGAEVDKFSTQKSNGANFNLIHLGIVDKQHGVPLLIRAMRIVLERFPQVHLYIVGDGRDLSDVKSLAKKLQIYQNCIFTGHIEYTKVKEILGRTGIGIIPRPNNLANNLVVTLKLLEYWASGTAVVASRLNGISEIAEDEKDILFFEADNYRDIAAKIEFLLSNSEELARLQRNGREKVRQFDWEKIIPEIVNVSLKLK